MMPNESFRLTRYVIHQQTRDLVHSSSDKLASILIRKCFVYSVSCRAGGDGDAAAAALNGPANGGGPVADENNDADLEVVPEGLEQDAAALKVCSH